VHCIHTHTHTYTWKNNEEEEIYIIYTFEVVLLKQQEQVFGSAYKWNGTKGSEV
jgi:hypothetical protein